MRDNQTKPDGLTDITIRLSGEAFEAIDALRSDPDTPHGVSREDAIRIILKDWLIGHGYMPD